MTVSSKEEKERNIDVLLQENLDNKITIRKHQSDNYEQAKKINELECDIRKLNVDLALKKQIDQKQRDIIQKYKYREKLFRETMQVIVNTNNLLAEAVNKELG